MIKKIKFLQYRKLKNIEFEFCKNINLISGSNGTCKSSLLHIIGNSFQKVHVCDKAFLDNNILKFIRTVNNIVNPKIESLVRGDKEFNDPAPDIKGTIYTTEEFDKKTTPFRRHNSTKDSRYAVKPRYPKNSKESLTKLPVIYLGLSRLFAYGEFDDDKLIKKTKMKISNLFHEEIKRLYKSFTGIEIKNLVPEVMGNIKKRTGFSSTTKGIDSNTISAGEDNLIIILSTLLSLKSYFESIKSSNEVESILLIDELDATLHPAYQIKLLDLFRDYSKKYRIQFFFTSHSLSLIEECLKRKDCHVEYLIDNITNVIKMPFPDIYKIKLHLNSQLKREIYGDVTIPVFTEDKEARVFLEIIFNQIETRDENFAKVCSLFHLVDASIGAENLEAIFTDSKILRTTIRSICILDGDQKHDVQNQIITLPGSDSPEVLAFNHLKALVDSEDDFWSDDYLISNGYSKIKCNSDIVSSIEEIDREYQEMKKQGETTKGFRRKKNKALFDKYLDFFKRVLKHWIKNNNSELVDFADKLHTMFIKVSGYHEINPSDWQKVSIAIRDTKKRENGEQLLF